MKSLNVLDIFYPLVAPKAPKLTEFWLGKHTAMMRKMEDFSYFFPKSTKLLLWGKNKKNPPLSSSSIYVCRTRTLSILELLVQPGNEKTFKLFIFQKQIHFICFPLRFAILNKKKHLFPKKKSKRVGNRQTTQNKCKCWKIKNFFQHTFSIPIGNQTEKSYGILKCIR